MNLRILLPFGVFADEHDVSRVVAETTEGSFGFLPQRLDCVAALVPGILYYESAAEGGVYLAVDEGVLVKTGPDMLVSVRSAQAGKDLGQLRQAVEDDFRKANALDRQIRSSMLTLENQVMRQLAVFEDD